MVAMDFGAGEVSAKRGADRLFARKKLRALAVPAVLLAYLTYIFFAFDIGGLAGRLRPENAAILLSDFWSYKTHVTRDSRSGETSVSIEGERKGTYPADRWPDWVTAEGEATRVALPGDETVLIGPAGAEMQIPGYGVLEIAQTPAGITLTTPDGTVPDWISASRTRVGVTTEAGRLTVTKSKVEVFRRFAGWEMFFFTLDSPYFGKSPLELLTLATTAPRLDPAESNIAGMADDFWHNAVWRHSDVAWALFETLLMAFLGTFGAGLIALPLAFLSAKGFAPSGVVRQVMRRLFDLLRGVDGLIWTIVLSRAFGPGPLTGALAILLTDTGSFGKLFSEALENSDRKQVEGLRATGANALQRNRFGVLPQIAPVILSQLLYYLESNTRSATVIGAIVGGGIGLLLTQAIITQRDWEEVSYYIVLIILLVMLMDWISGKIRRKLIGGSR